MDVALWVLAGAMVLVGIIGMVLPLLPGTPLLFGGLWLAAFLDGYQKVGVSVVVVLAVLAVLAWVVDYVAAVLGVKRVGASGLAMAGAAAGALVGILGGIVGLIVGPIVGAMAGEMLARRNAGQATRVGIAAGLSFIAAVAVKLGIAAGMLAVFVFAYLV